MSIDLAPLQQHELLCTMSPLFDQLSILRLIRKGALTVKPAAMTAITNALPLQHIQVHSWQVWCDGSFFEDILPTTKESTGQPVRMGWAFIVCARTKDSDSYAIAGAAAGYLHEEDLHDYGFHRPGADAAEAFCVHQAVKWATAQTEPTNMLYDSKVAGGAAAGDSSPPLAVAQLTRATRGLLAYCSGRHAPIIFEHVKAHSGVPCNELADDIAKVAARGICWSGQPYLLTKEWYVGIHPAADWCWLLSRDAYKKQ